MKMLPRSLIILLNILSGKPEDHVYCSSRCEGKGEYSHVLLVLFSLVCNSYTKM